MQCLRKKLSELKNRINDKYKIFIKFPNKITQILKTSTNNKIKHFVTRFKIFLYENEKTKNENKKQGQKAL